MVKREVRRFAMPAKQATLPFKSKQKPGPSSPVKKATVAPKKNDSEYEDIELSDSDSDVDDDPIEDADDDISSRPIKALPARAASEVSETPTEKPPLKPSLVKWNKLYREAEAQMNWQKPVHTEGENKIDYILRVFDMTEKYGPVLGLTRLERWERAKKFRLNPPPAIREILLTKEGSEQDRYVQSVLYIPDPEA
ncbi:DNA polymerase delta, subunit 4-domain-containing protein [Flagelloscypha sp. PMI_526]|nr:DNA polymerase delta, subunit 4-domain-containing protein [Flagelloscypha sp. PMI_526]